MRAPGWLPVIEGMIEGVWVVDAVKLRILAINGVAADLIGIPAKVLVGKPVIDLAATPEDICFWEDVAAGQTDHILSETLLARADGSTVHVERSVSRVRLSDATSVFIVSIRDQSNERRVEAELEKLVSELRATLESTADGILVTDLDGAIRSYNQRFAEMWSLPTELLTRRDDDAIYRWMGDRVIDAHAYADRLKTIAHAPLLETSDIVTLRGGTVLERVTLPQYSRGRPIGRVYSFRDITEMLNSRKRIEELAYTDTLTGLPNRPMLNDRLGLAIAQARRSDGCFALLFIDLDRFKQINDSLGHVFGDRVLVEVAARIREGLRLVDTAARLGGDEFLVLLHNTDARGAKIAAQRILDRLSEPILLDELSFTVTSSIGIALFPHDGDTIDDLVKNADAAMYHAKDRGRADFSFYQKQMNVDLLARMKLDHAMRAALQETNTPHGFQLHYQPLFSSADDRVIGAEALLRWNHTELGDIPPERIIPVAEDTGFILQIGRWVLDEALRQCAAWNAKGLALSVSINVSAQQFLQPHFVPDVADALERHDVRGSQLEIELTESTLNRDISETARRLDGLTALGIRLTIDDFGTGFSSLAYLKRFPIHKLKIDRSFIGDLPHDESDAAIVDAIIRMAEVLGIRVIAEGVETAEQHTLVLKSRCDGYQGFCSAPALAPDAFEAFVATRNATQA